MLLGLFCIIMATATGDPQLLTPDNAVEVMEKLLPAQNKTFQLGLKFKLQEYEVESIHTTYSKPRDRLLHLIIGFAKQGNASWRVIVEALRSPAIGLPALAKEIEAEYLSSCDPMNKTENDDCVKKQLPISDNSADAAVIALEEEIDGFHERFNSIKELTIKGLDKCSVTVMAVVFILTNQSS